MPLNKMLLEAKLSVLRATGCAPEQDMYRFGALITVLDDWDLSRVNPLAFGARHGFPAEVVVELFIHSLHAGLFDIHWRLVCVFCGAVEYVYDTIDRIPRNSFHCTSCDDDIDVALDDRVEVTFSLCPSIRTLSIDPFKDLGSYRAYFISSDIVHSPIFAEYLRTASLGEAVLAAGESRDFELALDHGQSARAVSYDRHAGAFVRADAKGARGPNVELLVGPMGIAPAEIVVRPGKCSIRVTNGLPEPTGVFLLDGDVGRYQCFVTENRSTHTAYFTAQMLLSHQTFRRLFRVQCTDPDLALNIRSQTVLFTDLKGSTELYDRIGDVEAYRIVREHFRELTAVTAAHSGAVVKTIGDAVMATFSKALGATAAALEMQTRVAALNRELSSRGVELGLRIGIHVGPVLIVNGDDRLDYFGQTVNIASRVQSLAAAGEICLTRAMLDAPGVADLVAAHDASIEEPVSLRGIGEPTVVQRFVVRSA